ncbi:Glutamine amidotransferase subunit pdxT [Spirochaeta thermophila DSM 6578]|uniref:Pyridoxal 5'-phosphate synthase subunit PdxT n=1 Tax=Winmispira thermophila (strain ATCC 700085 / DSM 6578 / Z-1203) TaxID=869211 RepID=G0GCH7_WINT7|nr:pyridoxal 5'-phosphate synthase glutaminase subunit PdxT [Spirochaeta thermophila]AEJ62043.1 Glutamine amidotransferase subunit pdxT [Spirochaeta thermophila DSM 6578]
MRVGILGLQGDFALHQRMLTSLGVETRIVRSMEDLEDCASLVIPGGESTTMGGLLVRFGMLEALSARIREGLPVFGTCAGAILLAREIIGYPDQPRLGVLDIAIERNAYGRQKESFETDVLIPSLRDQPYRAVFIRAPIIRAVGPGVEVLAWFEDLPILVRRGHILAATFHPELTDDPYIHRYFLEQVASRLTVR